MSNKYILQNIKEHLIEMEALVNDAYDDEAVALNRQDRDIVSFYEFHFKQLLALSVEVLDQEDGGDDE